MAVQFVRSPGNGDFPAQDHPERPAREEVESAVNAAIPASIWEVVGGFDISFWHKHL